MRSYEILRTQSTKFNIDKNDENLLIIKPNMDKLKKIKFSEIQEFVNEGKSAAKKNLSEIKRLISKSQGLRIFNFS